MNKTESVNLHITGHLKIWDPATGEVFLDKTNAIHWENMAIVLAQCVSNIREGHVNEMVFGNGGTTVDPTGIITYLTPNVSGVHSSLYNETYSKVVDPSSTSNLDPITNYVETRHINGTTYADIYIQCLLDYGEPDGQSAFDSNTYEKSAFVFDEIGLRGYSSTNDPLLLTHVIFHPIQKALNRAIEIDYTVRIQTLSEI